jgi:hypothetical protein
MKRRMNPRVRAVRAREDFSLELTFDDGEERIFDMRPFLSVGVFRALGEYRQFATATVHLGTVVWHGGQDLCPDTLYEDSVPVEKTA